MGSFWGTLAGAMMLGVTQQIGFRLDPGWGIWFGHIVFLAVLVLRPQGLFPEDARLRTDASLPSSRLRFERRARQRAWRSTRALAVAAALAARRSPPACRSGRESSWMREFVEIACYFIFAMMWNLLAGYGGMVSIGQQAFFGFGGYVMLMLGNFAGVNPFVAVPLGRAGGGG